MPGASDSHPLMLKVEGGAAALRIRIRGDLDYTSAERIERLLDRLGDIRGHTLSLDFEHVGHVDSTGLTAIVATKLRGDRESFHVRLERVPPQLERMLRVTGLDRLLAD